MNGKPEEIDKDGYHDQTQHTSHKLLTNLKLKQRANETITVVSQINKLGRASGGFCQWELTKEV